VTIVKEAVRHLTQRGLIEVVDYAFSGGERGTTYFIPLPPGTPSDAVRQSESDRRPDRARQSESDRQPESGPMKDLEKIHEKAPAAVAPASVYEIRTIAARIFEAHRGEAGFDQSRLRDLVTDALIGQGRLPDAALVEEAIRGMGP
jgi:hypothetical protein